MRSLKTGTRMAASLEDLADKHLAQLSAHPLLRALWRPRLLKALGMGAITDCRMILSANLRSGKHGAKCDVDGIRIFGKADRIDRLSDGSFAVVDYKTGSPPTGSQVENGYALQLGTIGLILRDGAVWTSHCRRCPGFEYWSLGRNAKSETGFGYVTTPLLEGNQAKWHSARGFPA